MQRGNSGLVIAERRDARDGLFTVTGDAISGARLTDGSGEDEILIGSETHRELEPLRCPMS